MNTTRPDLKTLLTSILDYSSRSLKFPTDDSIGIFHFHNFVDFLVHQGALVVNKNYGFGFGFTETQKFWFLPKPIMVRNQNRNPNFREFMPFFLSKWKLNWALSDINNSKIMCCWKAIFVWKQCWCHYETCKSCWNFSISYSYIYFVSTYLLFSTSFGFGFGFGFTKTVRFRFRFYRNPKSGFCWPLLGAYLFWTARVFLF